MNAALTGATRYFSGIVGSLQTLTVLLSGTQFYLTAASGPVFIRPAGGSYALFYSAMGDTVTAGFSLLAVYNPTVFPVTIQMLVGYSDVIDKRQLPSTQTPSVIYQIPFVGHNMLYPDMSGQVIMDNDGASWLAVQRLLFSAQTANSLDMINILSLNTIIGSAVSVVPMGSNNIVYAPFTVSARGYLGITWFESGSGSQVPAVYEIYSAVAPQSASYQPPN